MNGQIRIEIINQEIEQKNKEQKEAHDRFLHGTAKDLVKIIKKYIIDEKQKKKLFELLDNGWGRHLASELDEIKNNVTKKEKEIIDDFYWSVF